MAVTRYKIERRAIELDTTAFIDHLAWNRETRKQLDARRRAARKKAKAELQKAEER